MGCASACAYSTASSPALDMLFVAVAAASDDVAAASARTAKVTRLAALLRQLSPAEAEVTVSWLSGALTQRQIGVGWAALRGELPEPAAGAMLIIEAVEATFTRIGAVTGAGSQRERRRLLHDLFAAATDREQAFLGRLLGGELRQGALLGVMADAVARAADVPLADVRRAAMLRGDLPAVAAAALAGGVPALADFRLQVGRPIGPMLAQTAESTDDALVRLGGEASVEWKLDGARLQIHRSGSDVGLFTRTLDDVTARLPEIVDFVQGLSVRDFVADGEAIALTQGGRPLPFQVTASRVGSRDPDAGRDRTPLTLFVFDALHIDGVDLLDEPTAERYRVLADVVPSANRPDRIVTSNPDEASRFLTATLDRGHEGVMVKSLTAPYEAGRRGSGWLKVKPVHTLDLVVLAVEWGSGRRRGWLSNIHLGARDPATGGFVMLGKTFKGMTDEMLAWQTERFQQLASGPTDGWVVPLRPEQVVEIAFDGVQRSSRYPGGLALRFARVVRYRDDKRAEEADTIDAVGAFLPT
jgi:DNA ligase 1